MSLPSVNPQVSQPVRLAGVGIGEDDAHRAVTVHRRGLEVDDLVRVVVVDRSVGVIDCPQWFHACRPQ